MAGVKCIIFPDDGLYLSWGYVVTGLLIYTAIITPFRLALVEEETLDWFIIGLIIDGLFFTDVVINCFLAYFDSDNNIITSHKKIFVNYITGWMFLDLLACIPLQAVMS